jgi:hypothetical protein
MLVVARSVAGAQQPKRPAASQMSIGQRACAERRALTPEPALGTPPPPRGGVLGANLTHDLQWPSL